MFDPDRIAAFRDRLDRQHAWPHLYTFKFIVPAARAAEVQHILSQHQPSFRQSAQGAYVSLTYQMMMPGSEAVIGVYQSVSHIDGLIAL
jgi:putative lipoic acid-binding regulatory protein